MSNVTQCDPYAALADVYTIAGFSRYSLQMTPRLLELAFSQEWVGRTVLDLGCGIGEADGWLAEHSYRVIAVDTSAPMLAVGKAQIADGNLGIEWEHADMRTYKPPVKVDLALCIGSTLNLLPTLQDMESTFRQVSAALDSDKLFMFDLRTIHGLIGAVQAETGSTDRLLFDNGENAFIVSRAQFSYETLSLTTTYQIMMHNGIEWRRAQETHIERGYPVQAITRLLTKTGFRLLKVLDTTLETAEPNTADHLVFLAQKAST